MPTGNEFSDVRFGQSDQNYKQTDREMSGGVQPQIGGPDGPLPVGNYPRVFDREAGSEPLGDQSEDNPFYYPEKVYERIECTGPSQAYKRTSREQVSGEYGQCTDTTTGPYPGTDMVPSPSPSKQFSSKHSGDPKELLASTKECVDYHADLMHAYGYNVPTATMGSHPWLRDSLTTTSDLEPGNAEPVRGMKVPFEENE